MVFVRDKEKVSKRRQSCLDTLSNSAGFKVQVTHSTEKSGAVFCIAFSMKTFYYAKGWSPGGMFLVEFMGGFVG